VISTVPEVSQIVIDERRDKDPGVLSASKAHDEAMSLPIEQVVDQLVGLLGATAVAAIGNVKETRAVQQWMSGREPQRPNELRFALQLVTMIATLKSIDVARAWFYGANPHLDDAAPLTLLREQPLAAVQGPLLSAARSFASRDGV
jgi:hypothetical protein